MAPRTRPEAGSRTGEAVGALDRLYEARFDDFVPLRREMAAALRAAGDVAASRLVSAATKPSRTAWALNQVARRRPELVQAAFEARAKAALAQTTGEGEALRTTARAYREHLADLVQAAGDAVRADGAELTVAQGRRISATVQAVAGAEEAAARERLIAGRLVTDIDVDDPFGGLELGPGHERPRAGPPPRDDLAARRKVAEAGRTREREQQREREQEKHARQREQERQARQREQERHTRELEQARARVAALEDEARDARVAARAAEVAAGRAQAEAQRLRRAVESAEKRLGEAKAELRSRQT
jgi:hypothetical protein